MANGYSNTIYIIGVEFLLSFAVYHAIFWKVFTHFEPSKTPQDCLGIATSTVSTINAVLITVPSPFDFFYFRRWQNPTIDQPGLAAHILYEYIHLLLYLWSVVNYN